MKHAHILLLLMLFPAFACVGQIAGDTAQQLEEVVIVPNRQKEFTTGKQVLQIDSAALQSNRTDNLGELLSRHAMVYIKSSGPGNLSTISVRGSNAHHTPVLWNGFNLQAPTLGQPDFSYFPVSFADEVEIQYGGSGALFGSGAVGGAVIVNNPARFNKGVKAGLSGSAGSFDNYNTTANLSISKKRFISSLRVLDVTGKNDFPHYNYAMYGYGSPKVRQINAEFKQRGLLFENHFKVRSNQQLNFRVWLQENFRQVPPLMTNEFSKASLGNDSYRITSEWKRSGEITEYFVRTGYFNELQVYTDPLKNIRTVTSFFTSITEAESNIKIGSGQLLNIGVNNTYSEAKSDGYKGIPNQNRTAVFLSCKLRNKSNTWLGTASLREEYTYGRLLPFTPSLGAEGRLIKGLSIKGYISRNYRLPTFNDLYWYPGGNPNLVPEHGWSEELSLIAKPEFKFLKENSLSFTVFNSNIDQLIMWLPQGSDWHPRNVLSVWSRGLESSLKLSKDINKINVSISLAYNYVLSTNAGRKMSNDDGYGRQLIYVPVYAGRGGFAIAYKDLYMSYVHTYTGNSLTTVDNTQFISAYDLGSLVVTKSISMNKFKFNVNARVNNIWNKSYQAVQLQAMPLRNYQLELRIFFNKPNLNKEQI